MGLFEVNLLEMELPGIRGPLRFSNRPTIAACSGPADQSGLCLRSQALVGLWPPKWRNQTQDMANDLLQTEGIVRAAGRAGITSEFSFSWPS